MNPRAGSELLYLRNVLVRFLVKDPILVFSVSVLCL